MECDASHGQVGVPHPATGPILRYLISCLILVVIAGVALTAGAGSAAAEIPDCTEVQYQGDGSSQDPWEVDSLDQLQCMGHDDSQTGPFDDYVQTADIDASPTETWDDGAGFMPIGTNISTYDRFGGTYDGQDHEISGLSIDRPTHERVGLFYDFSGELENLQLSNASVQGAGEVDGRIGILAGNMGQFGGTARNLVVTGSVNSSNPSHVGGLAGRSGTVEDSQVEVTVDVDSTGYGGLLAGYSNDDVIRTEVTGTYTGTTNRAGGLVGAYRGTDNSISSVTVSGTLNTSTGYWGAGGLVGDLARGENISVQNSVSHVDVINDGEAPTGGLIGAIQYDADLGPGPYIVNRSYATGNVTGDGLTGGVVGELAEPASTSIDDSYWDVETTQQADGIGSHVDDGVTGLTTSEMQGSTPESTMAALEYGEDWRLNIDPADYPEPFWLNPELESIDISLENSSILVGETTTVSVSGTFDDGSISPVTEEASFDSTDSTVATVSSDGVVMGESEGDAAITASVNDITDGALISVIEEPLDAVPEAYYGTLTVNGEPASNGTVVEAMIDGEVRGSVTVETAGNYSSSDPLEEQLLVSGSEDEAGATVDFVIDPPAEDHLVAGPADQTSGFAPEENTELNLTATLETPEPPIYDLSISNDGGVHTIGFPGPVNSTLGELFDSYDGIQTFFSYQNGSWEQVYDTDHEFEALDVLVVSTTGDGPGSISGTIHLENETAAADHELDPGWNLIAAPAHSDAEDAFGGDIDNTLLVLDRFDNPTLSGYSYWWYLSGFGSYVIGSTSWGQTAPQVDPFGGYFVYSSGESAVPVRAQQFPHQQAADDLLDIW